MVWLVGLNVQIFILMLIYSLLGLLRRPAQSNLPLTDHNLWQKPTPPKSVHCLLVLPFVLVFCRRVVLGTVYHGVPPRLGGAAAAPWSPGTGPGPAALRPALPPPEPSDLCTALVDGKPNLEVGQECWNQWNICWMVPIMVGLGRPIQGMVEGSLDFMTS